MEVGCGKVHPQYKGLRDCPREFLILDAGLKWKFKGPGTIEIKGLPLLSRRASLLSPPPLVLAETELFNCA